MALHEVGGTYTRGDGTNFDVVHIHRDGTLGSDHLFGLHTHDELEAAGMVGDKLVVVFKTASDYDLFPNTWVAWINRDD